MKKFFLSMIAMIMGFAVYAADASGEQPLNVTFTFNSVEGLAALTPSVPAPPTAAEAKDGWIIDSSAKTNVKYEFPADGSYSVNGVVFANVKNTSTASMSSFYVQNVATSPVMQYRVYKNNTTSFAAPEGYALKTVVFNLGKASTKITVTGVIKDAAEGYDTGSLTTDAGDSKIKTWTAPTTDAGYVSSVEVVVTETVWVDSVVVTLEKIDGGVTPPAVDWSDTYVNVLFENNNWSDNGTLAAADGLNIHKDLAIGDKLFQIKTWNSRENDKYYSTGGAITPGEWVSVPEAAWDSNMTIAGAPADGVYDVEFNCETKAIKVTLVSGGGEVDPPVQGEFVDATFVFNTVEGLAALTPSVPAPPTSAVAENGWKVDNSNVKYELPADGLSMEGVNIKTEKVEGTNATLSCIYCSSPATPKLSFRVYKNNNITMTAPKGYAIRKMEYATNTQNAANNLPFKTNIENEDGASVAATDNKNFTWTAPAADKGDVTTVTVVPSNSVQINTITYSLEKVGGDEPEPQTLVVVGSFTNDWDLAAGIEMTQDGNTYTAKIDKLEKDAQFKIADKATWDTTWGAEGNGGEDPVALANGTAMNAWPGSSVNWLADEDMTDVTITFVRAENGPSSLTVSGTVGGDEPSDNPVLYLRGDINDLEADNSYKFTETKGVYTLNIPLLSGNFKISDMNWTPEYTFTTGNKDMQLDTEYDVISGPMMAMADAQVKDVTIEFNMNTMKLKVTGTPVTETVKTYWIEGTFTMWETEEMKPASKEGVYEYEFESFEEGGMAECVIYVKENGVTGNYFKQEEGTTFNENSPLTLVTNGGNHITFNTVANSTYKLTFDSNNNELKLTGNSGVENISIDEADAIYFNMQGLRVEKKAGELLIRVFGGKSEKVQY